MRNIVMRAVIWLLLPVLLIIMAACCFFGPPGYGFSGWVCVGLASVYCVYAWLHRQKQKKWALYCRRLLTVCLILGLIAAAVTLGVILSGSVQSSEMNDYIVVLGAGVHGSVPSMILSERIDAAYNYLSAHPKTIAILSGGQGPGEKITEAKCMFDILVQRGIEPQRLRMEENSTSTWENLRYSLALIEAEIGAKPQKIGLVSNEFHLYRACLLAKEQGVTACGIPARTGWVTLRINYYLREIAAMWKYVLLGGN